MLLEEIKVHRIHARFVESDDLVFPTSKGTPLHRANVSSRILTPAIEAAKREAGEDREASDPERRDEPHSAPDVRLTPLRGRRLARPT
jgi:hypothetical protein